MLKVCNRCKQLKEETEFYFRPKRGNRETTCKVCWYKCYKKLKLKSPNKYREYTRKWYLNKKKNEPWFLTLRNIQQRCNNPKASKYAYYGGKGIKCLLSLEEIKKLWFRDGADKMNQPSIDRESPEDHYVFEKCKFIEFDENRAKSGFSKKSKNKLTSR